MAAFFNECSCVVTGADLGWDALGLVLGAIYIGGPLALLLMIVWIVYFVRSSGKVPGRVHALMILPNVCALMIFPIGESIKEGLARLEMNSQTLDFGNRPVDTTPSPPVACHDIPALAGGAFIDPAQAIAVRWQALAPQPALANGADNRS